MEPTGHYWFMQLAGWGGGVIEESSIAGRHPGVGGL